MRRSLSVRVASKVSCVSDTAAAFVLKNSRRTHHGEIWILVDARDVSIAVATGKVEQDRKLGQHVSREAGDMSRIIHACLDEEGDRATMAPKMHWIPLLYPAIPRKDEPAGAK
jgi:hypothetical protein